MLAYLDLLCSALIAHDREAIARLRADPAAAELPEAVREEINDFARLGSAARRAPLQTLHYYYQRTQLFRDAGASQLPATVQVYGATPRIAPRPPAAQIELPLFAA